MPVNTGILSDAEVMTVYLVHVITGILSDAEVMTVCLPCACQHWHIK
jgi:hypothetical protein